ncbi:hypothetical protein GCM10023143_28260 [Compostibacter hankyongensis]|uniref:DUF5977 domain-containing protein n=2 Tax=Compostibacter hankyongensis TaxID=1007089 RepID=A0ABP8G387_9BACT
MTGAHAQVNLQTGSAVFSLPMFNWQDDKSRLTSIIALNYNSGNGLKVEEIASNAGQGWNLIAGGVITRMQVGEPDDQWPRPKRGIADQDNDLSKYPPGYLYATVPAKQGCPEAMTTYPIYHAKNRLYREHNLIAEDRELDYFSFQFNGKSGMFVVDSSYGDMGHPLGDTKMKISFQRDTTLSDGSQTGIRTVITSFTIQDVDGLIYKFTKHGMSKVMEQGFCDKNATVALKQPKFKNGFIYYQTGFPNPNYVNPWIINNWYLSEIEDPLTGRSILFNYNLHTINSRTGISITYNHPDKEYVIVSYRNTVTQTQDIASISYPDGHTATFTYNAAERADMPGEHALSSVDIKYQNRYLSEYQLKTSYFIRNRYGTPVSDYEKSVARLCLQSVEKIGVDLKESSSPYRFDYYLGSNNADDFVPPPFFYARDIWGYYNGSASVAYNGAAVPLNVDISRLNFNQLKGLCFLKNGVALPVLNPKAGYAKNGLLKQIIYPTGGTMSYEYTQNKGTFTAGGADQSVGGVHVSQTQATDGQQYDCDNPLVTHYNYVMNSGGTSSLWGLEQPVNKTVLKTYYNPEKRRFHITWNGPSCYWDYQYPGILSQYQSIDPTKWQNTMSALTPVLGAAGAVSEVMDVAHYIAFGSGAGAVIVDVISVVASVGLTCFGSNSHDATYTSYYNTDLNNVNPLPAQFKRVEIVQGDGGAGKTVQTFTSPDDYPLWCPADSNKVFSSKQRFAPWAYGLPKLITVYDAAGHMVRQTEDVYNMSYARAAIQTHHPINHSTGGNFRPAATLPYDSLLSCKCEVRSTSSKRDAYWTIASQHPGDGGYGDSLLYYNDYHLAPSTLLGVDIYPVYTGRFELDTTYERVYRKTDASKFIQTYTAYLYNADYNYEVRKIAAQQSNGDVYYKDIRYNSDFFSGALNTLTAHNIVSVPVETITSVEKPGTTSLKYLGEQVTEYAQLSNGDIKPARMLDQRFAQPAGNMTLYDGPGTDLSAYKVTGTFTYDAQGNRIGEQDEGMHTVSHIYGYNDKYVIADVINANPVTDKPAYTSFEDTGLGGWALTGTASYATSAITGSRSMTLSAGKSLKATLNTAKPYTLSFWSAGSGITVSGGATLAKSGPTYNGFTYYEYQIAQGTASVTVTGTTRIDELRLYPQQARMSTTTYDPLIGKTSECDQNNRITYYEYDNLGRMRFVKDEKKETLKMYEYNNVSEAKQNGCPGIYYNHALSEVFRKSNCSAGTAPDTNVFVYTVPANKYSSTRSQAEADILAEIEMLTNGQAQTNANSSCIPIYYNTALTVSDSTETCDPGEKGGLVAYTVPAGRYSSYINQADAQRQAQEEADANAQAFANDSLNRACVFDSSPDWEGDDDSPSYCGTVGDEQHKFLSMTDQNPNSPTYNQSQYFDMGLDDSCPECIPGFTYDDDIPAYSENEVSLFQGSVHFDWAFRYPGGRYCHVGHLNSSCCFPMSNRILSFVSGSTTFHLTIYTNGNVDLDVYAGPIPTGSVTLFGSYSVSD